MIDISVLLPVRDWDLTRVDMCLRSLSAANEYQVEVVVIDYGSRDAEGIRDVALSHGCTFQRVDAADWSRSNAMNTAAEISSGRNLIFADADLVFAPTVLPRTIERLDQNPNSVLMFQFRDLPSTIKPEELLDSPDFDFLDSQAVWRPRWGMGVQAYTRRAFEFIRGFDDRMKIYGGEDNDIAKRARANGFRLEWVNSPDFGLYHVWHPSSRQVADSSPETKAEVEKNAAIAKHDRSKIRNLASWRAEEPLVSVVITTFNRAEYLADSINSVLNQTVQDFELLILDDGSTDNTQEVVESFDDERISYFREEKSGIPVLRNKALAFSRGRYTAIHDDDDIMLPWSLETRLKALESGLAGSYGGAFDFSNETGSMELFPGREADLSSVLDGGKVFYHAALLIETDVLRQVGYDDAFQSGSDFNLALRLMKVGVRVAHCGDVVLLRRLHRRQVTVTDQVIQHGASYATSFSQRAGWGTGGRWRSRERSKEFGPWQYDEGLTNHPRVRPYLPDHLVKRSVIIESQEDLPLPEGAIFGEFRLPHVDARVMFIHEATVPQLLEAEQQNGDLPNTHVWMAGKRYSPLDALQQIANQVFEGQKFITVNPHLLENGFLVVGSNKSSEVRPEFDLKKKICLLIQVPEEVEESQYLDELFAGV